MEPTIKLGGITDPVLDAVKVFLKGLNPEENYGTMDEVGNFVNQSWKSFMDGLQNSYEGVYKRIMNNPTVYGIKILGGGDAGEIVNENAMADQNEQEDPFQTDEEKQGANTNLDGVFDETGNENNTVVPQ